MAGPGTAYGRISCDGGVKVMVFILSIMSLGTCIVAGVFYAFSDFMMRSLGAIPNAQGAAAMVSINRVILRASFVPMLLVLGPMALGVGVWVFWSGAVAGTLWVLAASGIYLIGVLGVTILGNVPMNNRLDRANDPSIYWPDYATRWTRLNTVRTGAAGLASIFYLQAALAIAANPVT